MFLEFNEGSFLWEWHHSSLWLVAFLIGVLGVALAMTHRISSVTGRTLKFLAFGSLMLTIPLGLVRVGLAPGAANFGLVGELGLFGLVGSLLSIVLPCLVVIILHSSQPGFSKGRAHASRQVSSTLDVKTRVDDLPGRGAQLVSPIAETMESSFVAEGWQLTLHNGSHPGRTYRLSEPETILGRSSDCDVVIDDPYVSRKHAKLSVEDSVLSLTDTGSKSGTVVDGIPAQYSKLVDGSLISLGKTTMTLSKVLLVR